MGWKGLSRGEIPIVRGILDFLRENDDVDRSLAKRIVDRLKGANLYQIRKAAFKGGYSIFDDETYIEEAKEERSKKVRKWASNLKIQTIDRKRRVPFFLDKVSR